MRGDNCWVVSGEAGPWLCIRGDSWVVCTPWGCGGNIRLGGLSTPTC